MEENNVQLGEEQEKSNSTLRDGAKEESTHSLSNESAQSLEITVKEINSLWFKDVSFYMSVFALMSSLALGIYTTTQSGAESVRLKKQDLTDMITELTEIVEKEAVMLRDVEKIRKSNKFSELDNQYFSSLGTNLANRRITLLYVADELVKELGDQVPPTSLIVLATAHTNTQEFDIAESYFLKLISMSDNKVLQATGHSSLASIYTAQGIHRLKDAEKHFQLAIDFLREMKAPWPIGFRAHIWLLSRNGTETFI